MTDIVERLRHPPKPVHGHENYLVMAEAAREIERLREAADEIEYLRTDVTELRRDRDDYAAQLAQYAGTTPSEVIAVRNLRRSFAEFDQHFPDKPAVA